MSYFAVKSENETSYSFMVVKADSQQEAQAAVKDPTRLVVCRCGSMQLAGTVADALNYYKAKTLFDGGPEADPHYEQR